MAHPARSWLLPLLFACTDCYHGMGTRHHNSPRCLNPIALARRGASPAARQYMSERFFCSAPATAGVDVEPSKDLSTAIAACSLLEQRLGLSEAELGALLERLPSVLDCNAQQQLGPTLDFLTQYVGKQRLGEFVRRQPQALLWQAEGMSPVAQHLRALGLPDADVRPPPPGNANAGTHPRLAQPCRVSLDVM